MDEDNERSKPGRIVMVTPRGEEEYTGWWIVPPEAAIINERDCEALAVAELPDGRFVLNWCEAQPWGEPWDPGGWTVESLAGERYVYQWGDYGHGATEIFEDKDELINNFPAALRAALSSLLGPRRGRE
jgi:hypothetical protein